MVLKWVLKIFEWGALIVIAALTFTIVSSVVCAPFNDALSRRTSMVCFKNSTRSAASAGLLTVTRLELRRTLVLILGGFTAFCIGLIPLLQVPALMLGSLLISFEFFGYPIARYSNTLRPVWSFTLAHMGISLGQGFFLLLLMTIPFASVLYIPLAVISGTLLYEELLDAQAAS